MALFEKGNNIGNRFTSENQPKKNGRKPSMYKQLKELTGKKVDYELSKEDYYKTIRFLLERSKGVPVPASIKEFSFFFSIFLFTLVRG